MYGKLEWVSRVKKISCYFWCDRHSDLCSQAPGKQFQIVNRTRKTGRKKVGSKQDCFIKWRLELRLCIQSLCNERFTSGKRCPSIWKSPWNHKRTRFGAPTATEFLFPLWKPSPETVDTITSRRSLGAKGGQTEVRSQTMSLNSWKSKPQRGTISSHWKLCSRSTNERIPASLLIPWPP